PKFDNVVLIKGALSRKIDKDNEYIKSVIKEYGLDAPLLSKPTIGVLLGGESKYLSLDIGIVKIIINSLDEVISKLGGSVLISTSRRTARDVEEFLKARLSKRIGYRMLIIANESNPQGSLEAILHLSDILVVTGDSISMMSEAVNSNKHTIILKLKRKKQNFVSKHEKFAENLEKDGYAYICENNLSVRISEIWKQGPAIKESADQKNIVRKLEEIL
ncbi:ELM1/GtrOC1 family putative glycosyltransferase, partial [Candidatus Omnitrophota bacterium]